MSDLAPWGRVRTWKISNVSGKGDVCEELRMNMVDMRCLQVRCEGKSFMIWEMEQRGLMSW